MLASWKEQRQPGPPPRFRVVFLTKNSTRVKHMLWMANELAHNKERRLVLAATQDEFLQEPRAVTAPILLDHQGRWQSLINLHPGARFLRDPVRLAPPVAQTPFV